MEQEIIHLEHYPEEYKSGKVTFFGREFRVTPDVLIPRLETEGLIRRAREIQKVEKFERIVDVGCGSGIIGTSMADLTDEIIFLDISPEALRVSEKNFRTHYPQKRAEFIISDLLSNFPKDSNVRTLFLANLPYIKGGDWEHMSADTHYEPELALFGGDDTGFELYVRLFEQLGTMNAEGRILIEFGFDQREIAQEIIKNYGWKYEFFADFAGIERFCEININGLY